MKGFIVTTPGLEEFCVDEVNELLGAEAEAGNGFVVFESGYEGICKVASLSRSARRVGLLFDVFGFDGLVDLADQCAVPEEYFELFKGRTFRVSCDREGKHDFNSGDVDIEAGAVVKEYLDGKGLSPVVSLEDPDLVVYCFVSGDACLFGLDFVGFDLSVREYKVYSGFDSFKGHIAYCMSAFCKGRLLDPFCGDGIVGIEAALKASGALASEDRFAFSKLFEFRFEGECFEREVFCFDDSLKNVKNARNNAAIADVDINFSKVNVEWLDTQFNKGEIDCIATHPPQVSKRKNEKDVLKVYDEFFYQAKFVLSEKGCIVALMNHTDKFLELAGKHGFELVDKKEFSVGDLDYYLVKLE